MFDLLFYIKIKHLIIDMEPKPVHYLNYHQEYHIKKNCPNENDFYTANKPPKNDVVFMGYVLKYFEYFNIKFFSKDYMRFLCNNRFNMYSL